MKVAKWIQIFLIITSFLTLAACHSRKNQAAINGANAAYASNGAQSSGMGDDARFNDDSRGEKLISQHVYYFDFDSTVVRDQYKPAIFANAEYLKSHPNLKVMLEGHTDPRGSREYNIGLGERRGKAVAELFTMKGVSPAQIRIVSYGAEKLAADGHSEAAYQKDRRVVLVYLQR